MRRRPLMWTWPSLAAVALLGGMGVESRLEPKPADARAYHARIVQAARLIPMRTSDGRWVGQEVPVPLAAVKMLSPNVIVSRRYVDTTTGVQASLLLVQCGDARDMTAHYPPVCLHNAGWQLDQSRLRRWTVDNLDIPGTQYQFSRRSLDETTTICVCDFMILPDGRFVPDMDAVIRDADDVTHRYFGAAQVQVVTDVRLSPSERDAAFAALVGTLHDTLQAIRSGGTP